MILNRSSRPAPAGVAGGATIDALLRRAAETRPGRLALADAGNRPHLIGGEPRRLTWAGLDAIVDRLAGRLQGLGLAADSVVATQFALSSEAVIALLALARAGMIAAPIPLGWGRRETVTHLKRIGARAILAAGRAGPVDCADLMRFAAAEVFSVRFVLSIGGPPLDGVVPLDDALDPAPGAVPVAVERTGNAADHIVLVTADATAEGHVAVARSHDAVIAGGLAAFMAGAPDEGSVMAATLAPDSFAGLALQVLPWLFGGGLMVCHPPLALRVLVERLAEDGVTHLVLPAAASAALAAAPPRALATLRHVTFLARRGEEIAAVCAVSPGAAARHLVFAAGEAGLARITPEHGAIPLGPGAGTGQAPVLSETRSGPSGTLLMRGAMVPAAAFPPGAEHGRPPFWSTDAEGFRDTGIPVRPGPVAGTVLPGGPVPGVVAVGGCRFAEADLRAAYAAAGGEVAPVVRPDPVLGQRIGGVIGDGRAVVGLAARLQETGVTPLGIPGAGRHGGPLPFQDSRPPASPERDAPAGVKPLPEPLLGVTRAAARG